MFDYLCYKSMDSYLPKEKTPSYIRILQACPEYRKVNIYSNGHQLAKDLGFAKFTPYLIVPAGLHNISIRKGGSKQEILDEDAVNMEAGEISTLAAVKCDEGMEIIKIPDPHLEFCKDNARIRFVNLSSNTSSVDLTLSNGDVLFSALPYKQITEYIYLSPGKYNFHIKSTDTGKVLAVMNNIELKSGWNSTVYAVENPGGKPGLKMFIPLDGNTYITRQ